MSENINLVENRSEQLERKQKALKIVRIIAVSMLITIALISVLSFILSSQIPLSAIKQAKDSTISEITALHNKLATYYLLKDRISNVNLLLLKRKDYTKATGAIFSKIPSNVTVAGMSIEEDSLTLNFSSNSLLSLNTLINDLIDLSTQKKLITNIKLQSLTLDAQSKLYSLTLIGNVL